MGTETQKNSENRKRISRAISKRKLGEVLVEIGLLSKKNLKAAIEANKKSGKRLGETLIEMNLLSEEEIAAGLAIQLRIPYIDLASYQIQGGVLEMIPEQVSLRYLCIAIGVSGNILDVAMADPLDLDIIKDLQFLTGFSIQPSISTPSQIFEVVEKYYHPKETMEETAEELNHVEIMEFLPEKEEVTEDEPEVEVIKDSPFVRIVDLILKNAIKSGTSDIHIEAQENSVRVRNRIDGVLQDAIKLPKWTHQIIISRIKVLGGMDISMRRIPQDGRMKVKGKDFIVDLRVSTLPTYYGEKAVIRILDKEEASLHLKKLGFSDKNEQLLKNFIKQPQGMVLITGPTGSGKTSTLYACIQEAMSDEVNILTVEDPVEFEMEGINQVQINERVGLTFPFVLRSILRQDPNVIMIGEIRDAETAEISLQASMTGHLALSTLHTNDAPSSVTRLLDIGIPPYLIASAVTGIVAQRLVRKICPYCKEDYVPSADLLARLNLNPKDLPYKFYHGTGCSKCNHSGYKGRTVIEEVMVMGHKIRELIQSDASTDVLREAAVATGMATLGMSGLKKIEMGVTTIDEVLKAVQQKEELTSVCPHCTKEVSVDFKNCPYCNNPLVPNCNACERIIQPDWIVCPYCRNDLVPPGASP